MHEPFAPRSSGIMKPAWSTNLCSKVKRHHDEASSGGLLQPDSELSSTPKRSLGHTINPTPPATCNSRLTCRLLPTQARNERDTQRLCSTHMPTCVRTRHDLASSLQGQPQLRSMHREAVRVHHAQPNRCPALPARSRPGPQLCPQPEVPITPLLPHVLHHCWNMSCIVDGLVDSSPTMARVAVGTPHRRPALCSCAALTG